ncbi:hypothetical protein FRB96_001806 [Tulasnella sp. 330]|nr:hypothetical protein FRB96_001806 [Tulasnella sp. 330]
MSQLSPAATLMWAILSMMLCCFLLYHLYQFDKFQCLKWSSRQEEGSFKRMLTYTYLFSVPLFVAFAVTLTVLKYHHGYTQILDGDIILTPLAFWSDQARTAAKVAYAFFAVSWALEMVAHLEELNFWLFLLTTTSTPRQWQRSPYFYIWCAGSIVALIGMPVAVGISSDQNRAEANVFLAGSLGSAAITLASLRVNWIFPRFIKKLRGEGAEPEVVCRLAKFNELNNVRIAFRFLLVVPTMILGIQGIRLVSHVERIHFWMDLLAILAGVGTAISSAITLLVFFPRASLAEMISDQERQTLANDNNAHHRRHRSSIMSQHTINNVRRVSLAQNRYNHHRVQHHQRSISSLKSFASIDYPAPAVSKSQCQVNTLELELDSWTLQNGGSNCSIPYSVTIERHDDTGAPILGLGGMGFGDGGGGREEKINDGSLGAVTDMSYEEMRAKGMRYCEVVSRRLDGSESEEGVRGGWPRE